MRYMNDYDLQRARQEYAGQPNRLRLVDTVDNLRRWADRNSDGWAYWPKPCRAAARAMEAIAGDGTWAATRRPDLTDAEAAAALRPIKAFLTRTKVDHAEVIGPVHRPYCLDCLQPRIAEADRHCRATSSRRDRTYHRWSND